MVENRKEDIGDKQCLIPFWRKQSTLFRIKLKMAKAHTHIQCCIILRLIKTIYMQGSEQEGCYGKHFSPRDSVPDVLRLMGAIRGDQVSVAGLIKLDGDPASSNY